MVDRFSLSTDRVALMDGAMATQLQLAGAQPGECFEQWNLTHPDRVRAIHQAYVTAGADILLTNTFQANPVQLERHGLLDQGEAICQAAVNLTRSVQAASGGRVRWVLGDIGPMTEQPGGPNFPRVESVRQVAAWLAGVDAILLETCSDWSVWQAVDCLREATDLPILLSLTFMTDSDRTVRSWDRHGPEEFARCAVEHNLAALGVNCGTDQDMGQIADTLHHFRQATDLPLFARPNAGTPVQRDRRWYYPLSAEQMANQLPDLLKAGAIMVGGCCGTTPAHIAAFRRAMTMHTNPQREQGTMLQ